VDGNGIGTGCGFLACGRRRKCLTSRGLPGADDGRLVRYDTATGEPRWEISSPLRFPAFLRTWKSALVRLRRRGDRAVEVRSCAVKNRTVSNRNCAGAIRGGEQRNENDQSVTRSRHTGTR